MHCRISDTHFLLVGHVDDGTHCDYDSGACVSGVCHDMPDYVVGTQPPSTSAVSTSGGTERTTKQPREVTTNLTTIPTAESSAQPETTKPTPSVSTYPTSKICVLILSRQRMCTSNFLVAQSASNYPLKLRKFCHVNPSPLTLQCSAKMFEKIVSILN